MVAYVPTKKGILYQILLSGVFLKALALRANESSEWDLPKKNVCTIASLPHSKVLH